MKLWMLFVLGAIVFWGAYVPTIHAGQIAIGTKNKALWAFLWVGMAYCLVAVLAPAGIMAARGELTPLPSVRGSTIALIAGVQGALGALCVILALWWGGNPLYVAPLVFAGAPVVNTLVSMSLHPPKEAPNAWYFAGIVLAAAGAAMVLRFKPS